MLDFELHTLQCEGGRMDMYSKEYEAAKKESVNCLWMRIIGLGVPIYNAFHE